MTIEYVTVSHEALFHALGRFFKYVLETELVPARDISGNTGPRTVLVLAEEKEHPIIIEFMTAATKAEFVVLSYDYRGAINLLEFDRLAVNFQKLIHPHSGTPFQLFSPEELRDKASRLFRSHGEESLLKLLNFMLYAMRNHVFLMQDELSYDDYYDNFIAPAMENWQKFTARLDKHSPFLEKAGYSDQLAEIQRVIQALQIVFSELSQHSPETLTRINCADFNLAIDSLTQIDDILGKIAADLGIFES